MNRRQVRRKWGIDKLSHNPDLTKAVFNFLVDSQWLLPVEGPGGHRAKADYEVNPLVYEGRGNASR